MHAMKLNFHPRACVQIYFAPLSQKQDPLFVLFIMLSTFAVMYLILTEDVFSDQRNPQGEIHSLKELFTTNDANKCAFSVPASPVTQG